MGVLEAVPPWIPRDNYIYILLKVYLLCKTMYLLLVKDTNELL